MAAATLMTVLLASAPADAHSAPPANRGADRAGAGIQGRLIVMPRAGLPEAEMSKALAAHGGQGRKIGQSNLYIVELPRNASPKAVAAQLAHHPAFKFVELDQAAYPDFVPNDPYYGSAWHLPIIGAPAAWDHAEGAGVTIAILDSGVDSAHPDLAGKLVPGWNYYNNNADTADVYGHGTKVAGAAAAAGNNGVGVASVAGQARIMPIRVSGTDGMGYWSAISQGVVHAADHGARVANISFLGVSSSASVRSAAQYMKDKGGLVIVSGGNTGALEAYTATTSMIPVAATDGNDARTGWSSYGDYIALAAPGAGIWSTTWGGGYGAVSGTSFSSPVTAGVVALMMSAKPALPSIDIERLLFATATDLGAAGRDPYYGHGRVDALRAVQAAAGAEPMVDAQAPSVSITSPSGGVTVAGLVPVNVAATDDVGVTRVELQVNGTTVAVDTSAPFAYTWDSKGAPNGMATLVARAFDAAGNEGQSAAVSVNVANETVPAPKDTTAPQVQIVNPVAGTVSGRSVTITVNASDDSGAAGIRLTLFIDGVRQATGKGSTLGYNWNLRKEKAGSHTIEVQAQDAAGNISSASVAVTLVK